MSVPNKTDEKSRFHLTATLARIDRLSYDANVSRADLLELIEAQDKIEMLSIQVM